MSKSILVTGATGKQGSAVVDELLKHPETSSYQLIAVTRDTASGSAQKLAKKSPNIKLLQGNLDDVPSLFTSAKAMANGSIWGVYSVQISQGKGVTEQTEINQGTALVDESVKNGVKHFVYSSVERGGDEKSWNNETPIPHFRSKYFLERHLKDKAGEKMGWTVLRPVAFMDNLTPAFPSKVFMAALQNNLGSKKLQWVATRDIGWFAAQAFANPNEWNHKALGLAGDDLNPQEVCEVISKKTGEDWQPTYSFLGSFLSWAVGELGTMIRWFGTDGYGADVSKLRQMNPQLMDFGTWLEKESPFQTK